MQIVQLENSCITQSNSILLILVLQANTWVSMATSSPSSEQYVSYLQQEKLYP